MVTAFRKIISNFQRSHRMLFMAALLTVIFMAFLFAGVIVRGQGQSAEDSPAQNIYYTNITVEKGDTLWNIAEEYMDYEHFDSIYEYMDCLTELNGFTSENLYAGERIMVVYYAQKQ